VVMPRGCPHPDEAMEFLAYLVSVKGQEILNLGQMKFPVLKKVTPEFWKKNSNPHLDIFRKLADSPGAFTAPRMELVEEFMDEGMATFDVVWHQEKTPEEALKQLQERMDKQWQKELKRFKRLGLEPPD